ncbi:MAG: hypothetical protein KA116_01940 [Proteobacteria bacterium]|nr:hypothetical protein [Pseudomonadota bacterium]
MRSIHSLFIILGLLLLQYCTGSSKNSSRGVASSSGEVGTNGNGNGGDGITSAFGVKVDWGSPTINKDVADNLAPSGYSAEQVFFQEPATTSEWSKFCFDNNNAGGCRKHSTSVRDTIKNNPSLMRGLMLMFYKRSCASGSSCTPVSAGVINATVRTHQMAIRSQSGTMVLSNEQTFSYPSGASSGACSANNSGNFVQYMPADPQPFTSVDIIDEASLVHSGSGDYYNNIYITSAVAIFSGLVPVGNAGVPFAFDLIPSNNPEKRYFGFYGDESSATAAFNNGNISAFYMGSKGIGTINSASASSITQAADRVVTGICIAGTKTVGSTTRPLVLKMTVKTYNPKLAKI